MLMLAVCLKADSLWELTQCLIKTHKLVTPQLCKTSQPTDNIHQPLLISNLNRHFKDQALKLHWANLHTQHTPLSWSSQHTRLRISLLLLANSTLRNQPKCNQRIRILINHLHRTNSTQILWIRSHSSYNSLIARQLTRTHKVSSLNSQLTNSVVHKAYQSQQGLKYHNSKYYHSNNMFNPKQFKLFSSQCKRNKCSLFNSNPCNSLWLSSSPSCKRSLFYNKLHQSQIW